jgi:hypothetical protein
MLFIRLCALLQGICRNISTECVGVAAILVTRGRVLDAEFSVG